MRRGYPSLLGHLLGSLAECESRVLMSVAWAIGLRFPNLRIDCIGTADMRGARCVYDMHPEILSVDMSIVAGTGDLDACCQVMNQLESKDVEVNERQRARPAHRYGQIWRGRPQDSASPPKGLGGHA